jgi:lipoic acid synthetase
VSETEKRTVGKSPVRPPWIRVRGIRADVQREMTGKLGGCNTVCLSAKCPNLGECFNRGVATFMIGGSTCTRACRFCGVKHGHPEPLDPEEPARVAESVKRLGLKFVVVTGVARDDLADGGAEHYAQTVREIRELNPGTGIEVLIPDFGADENSLRTVLDSVPDVLNHNVETVKRLTPQIRSRATYETSLEVLKISRGIAPEIPTKSGLMVGLGEELEEVIEALEDLVRVGCSLLTVGQYLQPRSSVQLEVARYWTPVEFEELRKAALKMGVRGVASGPFVRSSYFAEEMARESGL